jgi:hypothetical protein
VKSAFLLPGITPTLFLQNPHFDQVSCLCVGQVIGLTSTEIQVKSERS